MAGQSVDLGKLRAAFRRLSDEQRYSMLDAAMGLLPPGKLWRLVSRYVDNPTEFLSDHVVQADILTQVKAFEKASLAGEYYESFRVDSRNCMQMSPGTTAWIGECNRLLDRCVAEARHGGPVGVLQAFDTIFALLDHIDECLDDVLFFADEGGSWQVGVAWDEVLPPWFRLLSASASPEEYAGRITALLRRHYNHGSERMLAVACRIGTPEHRRALRGIPGGPRTP